MRFAFIDTWKEEWPIAFLCKVMQVTSRGFRAWRVRPMSQRQRDDMVILAHIREQHRLSLESYGRPRMTEELQELGVNVGHPLPAGDCNHREGRVGRLMRQNGIKIIRTQKYKLLGHPKDALPADGLQRTVITRSTSRPICLIKIFLLMGQTRNGRAIYPIFVQTKGGFASATQRLHSSHRSWLAILFE